MTHLQPGRTHTVVLGLGEGLGVWCLRGAGRDSLRWKDAIKLHYGSSRIQWVFFFFFYLPLLRIVI